MKDICDYQVLVGQVYIHPVTNCPLVVTKSDGERVHFVGYEIVDGEYDFKTRFTGAAYQDTFLEKYPCIDFTALIEMDKKLKDHLLSHLPEHTILTQGCDVVLA